MKLESTVAKKLAEALKETELYLPFDGAIEAHTKQDNRELKMGDWATVESHYDTFEYEWCIEFVNEWMRSNAPNFTADIGPATITIIKE